MKIIINIVGTLILLLTNIAAGQSIVGITNFVQEKNEISWTNLERLPIAYGSVNENQSVVKTKNVLFESGMPKIGSNFVDAIYMKARPISGKSEYGVLGSKVVTLPDMKYIQFQAGAKIVDGLWSGVDFYLLLETRDLKSGKWVVQDIFPCRGLNMTEPDSFGSCYFKEDLTKWGGEEVQLSLVLRTQASYMRVGDKEQWNPSEISVNIYMAEVVGTTFRISFESEEKVSSSNNKYSITPKSFSKKVNMQAVAPQTINISTNYNEYRIIKGGDITGESGYVANPSDLAICSEKVNTNPPFTVSYFSCRRSTDPGPPVIYYNEHDHADGGKQDDDYYGASARALYFPETPSGLPHIGTCSVQNVTEYIVKETKIIDSVPYQVAKQVLGPSGDASRDFDDHWTGISSVVYNTINENNVTRHVLHGFYYCEDHFQYEINGDANEHNESVDFYGSIGYARSTDADADFAKTFTKLYTDISSATKYPIITYHKDEDDFIMGDFSHAFGCGNPSVVPVGDYYYMAYATFSLKEKTDETFTKAWYLNSYGDRIPTDSCIGYATCGAISYGMLSMARAEITDVNKPRSQYENSSNPWKKYNVDGQGNPTWTENGIGGKFSAIWNAQQGNEDQPAQNGLVRYHPSFAYNVYLDKYTIMCNGNLSDGTHGIFFHTGSDPVTWDTSSLLIIASGSSIEDKYLYPSVVSREGKSYHHTGTYHYLFYAKPRVNFATLDLYRRLIRIYQ